MSRLIRPASEVRSRSKRFRSHLQRRRCHNVSPLPCWKHLPEETWRSRAIHLIEEIETETAIHMAGTGSQPLGAAGDPEQAPPPSPAPLFHAFTAAARRELWEAYRPFVAAFRQAADKLRAGDRNAAFPRGSFPPALPFVGG